MLSYFSSKSSAAFRRWVFEAFNPSIALKRTVSEVEARQDKKRPEKKKWKGNFGSIFKTSSKVSKLVWNVAQYSYRGYQQ